MLTHRHRQTHKYIKGPWLLFFLALPPGAMLNSHGSVDDYMAAVTGPAGAPAAVAGPGATGAGGAAGPDATLPFVRPSSPRMPPPSAAPTPGGSTSTTTGQLQLDGPLGSGGHGLLHHHGHGPLPVPVPGQASPSVPFSRLSMFHGGAAADGQLDSTGRPRLAAMRSNSEKAMLVGSPGGAAAGGPLPVPGGGANSPAAAAAAAPVGSPRLRGGGAGAFLMSRSFTGKRMSALISGVQVGAPGGAGRVGGWAGSAGCCWCVSAHYVIVGEAYQRYREQASRWGCNREGGCVFCV